MKYYCNHGQTPYEAYHTSYISGEGRNGRGNISLRKKILFFSFRCLYIRKPCNPLTQYTLGYHPKQCH